MCRLPEKSNRCCIFGLPPLLSPRSPLPPGSWLDKIPNPSYVESGYFYPWRVTYLTVVAHTTHDEIRIVQPPPLEIPPQISNLYIEIRVRQLTPHTNLRNHDSAAEQAPPYCSILLNIMTVSYQPLDSYDDT